MESIQTVNVAQGLEDDMVEGRKLRGWNLMGYGSFAQDYYGFTSKYSTMDEIDKTCDKVFAMDDETRTKHAIQMELQVKKLSRKVKRLEDELAPTIWTTVQR